MINLRSIRGNVQMHIDIRVSKHIVFLPGPTNKDGIMSGPFFGNIHVGALQDAHVVLLTP